MPDKNLCLTGLLVAHEMRQGRKVELSKFGESLGDDMHAIGRAARAINSFAPNENTKVPESSTNTVLGRAIKGFQKIDLPVAGLIEQISTAEFMLGREVVDDVNKIFYAFIDNPEYKTTLKAKNMTVVDLIGKYPEIAKKVWRDEYAPLIKEYKENLLETNDRPELTSFIDNYFKGLENGDPLFGKETNNPFLKLSKNVVANMVKQPVISLYNVGEIFTKPFGIAAANGDTGAAMRAYLRFVKENGSSFWKRIPKLEEEGVYGFHPNEYSDSNNPMMKYLVTPYQKGVDFVFNLTENPLRGISYYLGEELGQTGRWGVEKSAFVPTPANVPMALRGGDAGALALMRISLSATKMYSDWVVRAVKGDVNARNALIAYTAALFMTGGVRNAVPMPVDKALQVVFGDSYDEFADSVDTIGILPKGVKTVFGSEFRPSQPLAVPAFGLGYQMMTNMLDNMGRGAYKSLQSAKEGELPAAAAQLATAVVSAAMFAKVPAGDINLVRMVKTIEEVTTDEIDAGEFGSRLIEKSNLYKPGAED